MADAGYLTAPDDDRVAGLEVIEVRLCQLGIGNAEGKGNAASTFPNTVTSTAMAPKNSPHSRDLDAG